MTASPWQEVLLEDVADDVTVGHVGSMADEYVVSGVPFLRSLNVEPYGIALRDLKFISPKFHSKLRKSVLHPGDVVIVRTGRPGACTVIPDSLPEANCSDLVIVRCGPLLNPHYLSYFVNSVACAHIDAHLVGAVQQHFNIGSARKLKLALPSLAEQDRIVEVLGSLDNKIDLNRRMNETLEAMVRAIFKDWFVDFGPVRAKAEGHPPPGLSPDFAALFPDALDDEDKPERWKTTKLGAVCCRVAMGPFGSDITTDNFVDEGVPVIRGGNLKNGFVDEGFVFVTNEKATSLKNANAFSGDIVLTHRGTLGQVGVIPQKSRFQRYVVSQSQMLLSANTDVVSSRFLFEFLRSPSGVNQLLANTSQTGVPAISRPTTSLKAIEIMIPPIVVIEAFDQVIAPLAERISANIEESRTLAQLRDLLLPKLMSGEIRLKDAEKAVEAVA